ncbi:MAG: hypothetical protein ACT4NY_03175 [Pseudonocardiales bacterium]
MNLDELKAEFDRMEREAFRLQQYQSYAGVKGPEWDAWQVAAMHYDEQERFVEAAEPTEPIETYIARRDLAMKYAVPFEQWMAEYRDRLAD